MSENKSQASPGQVRGKSRAGLGEVSGGSKKSRQVIVENMTAAHGHFITICGVNLHYRIFLDNPAAFLRAVRRFLGNEKEGSPCKS